jgi:phosphomannomutase
MRKYQLSFLGLAVSLALWATIAIFDLDLFERFVANIHRLEKWEADELFFPVVVLLGFVYIDATRRMQARVIDTEKHVVYDAMLSATYHVVRNFLNQMQLFKMTAERTPDFPQDVLVLYDDVMQDALQQLEALAAINTIDPQTIRESVAPRV